MFARILVPLDGSNFGEHALPTALALAAQWGAGVELVRVATPGETGGAAPGGRDPRDAAVDEAERYLAEVRQRIEESGFGGAVGSEVIPPGNVARSLVARAGEVEAGLAIMTTHGRGPLQRAWLGSIADAFIRHAPVPTLLVRPSDSEEGAPALDTQAHPFRHILIPLDGSEASEALVALAAPFSAGAGTPTFTFLRAIPPFVAGGSPYLPHVIRETEEHEEFRKAAMGYLDEVAGRAPEVGKIQRQVVSAGQPAVAILRVAEESGADLIAMSTHGRGGVSRLLLGSVADKVVRGSSVPVLIYRAPEE